MELTLVLVMAATLSYFLLILPHSKQVQGLAKEGDHSEVVSAWMSNSSEAAATRINSSESIGKSLCTSPPSLEVLLLKTLDFKGQIWWRRA